MLYLIHGDQAEAARAKLIELKNQAANKEIREINGKRLDSTMLIQALESSSLFGADVFVIIEGFITHAKKREKSFTTTLSQIVKASETADIVLFEEKEVEKSVLLKLGAKCMAYGYKTPVVIFQFLDSVRPNNAATSLSYLSEVVENDAAEVVFALLVRRVRQLIQLKDNVTPEGLQEWQAGRLTSQARHFTIEQLVRMHKRLLAIDIAVKSSASPFTLTQQLEQFIINL
jgi:hypothetical protein